MNILDKIIENKKEEVQFQMKNLPLSNLEELIKINNQENLEKKRDFYAALSKKDEVNIIAEIKKASPSKGVIKDDFRPVELARDFEMGGACA